MYVQNQQQQQKQRKRKKGNNAEQNNVCDIVNSYIYTETANVLLC